MGKKAVSNIFYTLPEIWDFCLTKVYDREKYVLGFIELMETLGITKKSQILDAGCGSGFLTLDLIKRGFHIVGTDKNDEMIRQIKINAKNLGVKIEAHNFVWSDLAAKFGQNFDFVYCRGNSLVYAASWERNWIVPLRSYDEIKKAVENFYMVLKPGGYLYVDITSEKEKPHEDNIGVIEAKHVPIEILWKVAHDTKNRIRTWTVTLKILKTGKTKTYPSYSYLLSHSGLLKILQDAGFDKIKKNVNVNGEKNYDVFIAQK